MKTLKNASNGILALAMLISLFGSPSSISAQNSTRKIRVRPNQIAARIGTAVNWEASMEVAINKSKETGKPLFWYVATIDNTFMDRKDSIDRYMMAGPFSAPQIINQLNDNFVCLRTRPSSAINKRFNLKPYEFVEPGFLIISPKGELQSRVDRITTLHPQWFLKQLAADSEWNTPTKHWELLVDGNAEGKIPAEALQGSSESAIANRLLQAMLTFRAGDHEQATKLFKKVSEEFPNHPLGWKAAAEAQGFGPFVRGFEVYAELKPKALVMKPDSAGTMAPIGTFTEAEIWQNSVAYLLAMQRNDGAWHDSDYDFGGTDSLPNVHIAVTSLAAMALQAAKPHVPERQTEIEAAIAKAAKFVSTPANLNKVDRDEILWAHAYRTRFLSRLEKPGKQVSENLQTAVTDLESIQTKRGNWYHEYTNPFVTATALAALREASDAGATVDMGKVAKGLAALKADRFANGAYPYSSRRGGGQGTERNIAASAGRMPVCELGIAYWDQIDSPETQKKLTVAVQTSLDLHKNLASALKYDDHTSNMAYGGFFFWYDMRSRSEAILRIKDPALRKNFQQRQKELVMALPEIDGCFVDSHELGRCYGTAMALLCLQMSNVE